MSAIEIPAHLRINPSKGEKKILPIALADITISHNPRAPISVDARVTEGFVHENGEPWTGVEMIQALALNENPDERKKFVDFMEKYEAGEQGIIELAKSRTNAELAPVVLRSFRIKDKNNPGEYIERYGVVAGERRVLAAAYLYAKINTNPDEARKMFLVDDEEFNRLAKRLAAGMVGAVVHKMTADEAFDLAVQENAQRKEMNDLEYGRIFESYRKKTNPATGNNYTLKEIAAKLSLDYQFVRGRHALVFLSEQDQKRLEKGTIGVTNAIEKGLALKSGKSDNGDVPDKKPNRQRAMNLTQIQKLFDENRNYSEDYLQALADVMQVTLKVALKESNARIEQEELKAANKATREFKKKD